MTWLEVVTRSGNMLISAEAWHIFLGINPFNLLLYCIKGRLKSPLKIHKTRGVSNRPLLSWLSSRYN